MAVVEMKCPNCGGTMGLTNNQFMCPNCRTMVLNIMDAKIDADVAVMSPDEFAKKIEESKRQFVVNINDNIQVFDVQTRIINKKIADASLALENGKYEQVDILLKGVPANIFSAERLRFLSAFRVKNEYELSSYKGYIDVEYIRWSHDSSCYRPLNYKNLLLLADEQTKETYKKLAQFCREQHDAKAKMMGDIGQCDELFNVGLHDDALIYAKEMCRKYPTSAESWRKLSQTKLQIDPAYDCVREYKIMRLCHDYNDIPPSPIYALERQIERECVELQEKIKKFGIARFLSIGLFLVFGFLTACSWLFSEDPATVAISIGGAGVVFYIPVLIYTLANLPLWTKRRITALIKRLPDEEQGKFLSKIKKRR